jgi:hypothetical protein
VYEYELELAIKVEYLSDPAQRAEENPVILAAADKIRDEMIAILQLVGQLRSGTEQEMLDTLDAAMRRSFARQAYKPKHRLGYYTTVNEWLTDRGFEAESEEEIDRMELPPDLRRRAVRAEFTPSA